MADESKPKASFLSGKKAATPAPVEAAAPAPAATPAPSGGAPGFLKKASTSSNPPASAPAPAAPAPAQPAPPPPAAEPDEPPPPAPAPVAVHAPPQAAAPRAGGNRALAEQHLQRGLDHYDRQEADQALAAYQASVAADPTFPLAYNNLGMVLIDLERYDEALDALYTSIGCDPNYSEAYNNLGFVLRRIQRNVEAASAYTRFLQLEPDVEEGERIRGWIQTVLTENGLHAAPPFSVPQPAQPPPPPAAPAPMLAPPKPAAPAPAAEPPKIKKMAAWEAAAGNVETAAPVSVLGEIAGDAAPAPVIAPKPVAPAIMAPAPLSSPGIKPAAPGLQAQPPAPPVQPAAPIGSGSRPAAPIGSGSRPAPQAAPRKPDLVGMIESGMDQFAEGNLEQALDIFNKCAEQEPQNAEVQANIGKVLVRLEKLQEGVEVLQKAIELDKDDPAAYYVLGFALRTLERNIEAAEAYEVFLKLMPKAVDSEKIRQWVTHVKGVAGVSSTAMEDVSIIDDEQVVTETDKKYKEASQKFQEGDVDQALQLCVAILNEDAGHFRTRVLLGRAFLRQKNFDAAVEQLEGALVTSPDYPEALYFAAQAHEKKGAHDKAHASYKRYMEAAPEGPRAERVSEWLKAHPDAAPSGANVQCELCLRYFTAPEIVQHEGKATCPNCLELMGVSPTLAKTMLAEGKPSDSSSLMAPPVDFEPKAKSKGMVGVAALAGIAVIGGVLYFTGTLNPILQKVGLVKAPPPTKIGPVDHGPVTPQDDTPKFDGSKVKIANEPAQTSVMPFAAWTYKPVLEGIEKLDELVKGAKIEYALKDPPPGMVLDDKHNVVWTPKPTDFEELKKGRQYKVDLLVTGKAEGEPADLFVVSKSFNLSAQFGYEVGPEVDLGLGQNERVVLAAADMNGDKLTDLIVCSGDYRKGSVRMYVQRTGTQFPVPTPLSTGARFSTLHTGDVDRNGTDDLIVANWASGELKPFFQDAQAPHPGAAVAVGHGPIALGVGDVDGDKRMEVATLLGMGGKVAVTSLQSDRTWGPVVHVPLPVSGSSGWIFPWRSEQAGPGFIAVTPLADEPLRFIGQNQGKWDKVVSSGIEDRGVIAAAASMAAGSGAARRLAVIVTGEASKLIVLQEADGRFAPVGAPQALSGRGLGLVAKDFNRDGADDLFVVLENQCGFYFSAGNEGVQPGPQFPNLPKMLGQAIVYGAGERGPELLILNENRKAHFVKPVSPEAAPAPIPEAAAVPAPAESTPEAAVK